MGTPPPPPTPQHPKHNKQQNKVIVDFSFLKPNLNFSKITIISRNAISLNKLINNFQNQTKLNFLLSKDEKIPELIEKTDLIVNTTPVGMETIGNARQTLPYGDDFWKSLNSKTTVYDLIYNPTQTQLLKLSEKKGCMTINGIKMLIAQGAKSLSYWTDGLEVPFEVMHDALKKYL